MALTQISTQGIKDGTITGTELATNVDLVDNQKLRIGSGDDLQIFHDGSNSIIFEQGTGNLAIQSTGAEIQLSKGGSFEHMVRAIVDGAVMLYHDNSVKFETTSTGINVTNNITNTSGSDLVINSTGRVQLQVANGEKAVYCDNNGAVELYHDNSKKLNTNANGVHITDTLTFQNTGDSVTLADNQNVSCGNGGDLKIFHDGSFNKIIGSSAGNHLILRPNDSDEGVFIKNNDAVELYFDGSKKFETYASGIQATGNILTTTGDISCASDSHKITVGAGDDLQLFHNGSDSVIFDQNNASDLFIQTNERTLTLKVSTVKNAIVCKPNSAVELYHNNSKKFETDSDGGKLTGYLHAHARISESSFTNLDRHVIQTYISNKECLIVESTASTPFGMRISFNSASPDNNSSYFLLCRDQSVNRLFIYSDGDIDNHDNSYSGISDEKLKENIVDANSQWEDVKAIKVRNFNFKTDTPSDKRLGVVAQELETICPSLVKEKSDFDENNNDLGTKTKSVKYSILYMKAFKALQEAMTRIEVLETEVAALKAG